MAALRLPGRVVLVDGVVALLVCGLDLLMSWSPGRDAEFGTWAAPLYAAVGYLALAVRRRHPIPVFGVMALHSVTAALIFHAYIPNLGVWVALYTVAQRCESRSALACLFAAAVPAAVNVVHTVSRQPPTNRVDALIGVTSALVVFNGAAFGIGRWVGWSLRQRRIEAERAAADAVADERSRIARDLHDVVAHAVTLMLLQAGGAARFIRADPERARQALGHVDALGQQAIVELRRMLGLMRPELGSAPGGPSSLGGLGRLDDLVASTQTDDLRVELTRTGEKYPLEPGVDLCGYRIVQEALTNAIRYARPCTTVHVTVEWRPTTVELAVVNHVAGRPSRALATGHGVLGMRERARAIGGCLTAGVEADGTFAVRATLPTGGRLAVGSPATAGGLGG
ncbi:histidine kinase [Actinosynnema sp. NPDC002837]